MKKIIGLLFLAISGAISAKGQLTNGNFSNGLAPWQIIPTGRGAAFVDISMFQVNPSLAASPALELQAGWATSPTELWYEGVRVRQPFLLNHESTVQFSFDVACFTPQLIGTEIQVQWYIDGMIHPGFFFDSQTAGSTKYGSISGEVLEVGVGSHNVDIEILSRFRITENTARVFIDNVALSAVPVPESSATAAIAAAFLTILVLVTRGRTRR